MDCRYIPLLPFNRQKTAQANPNFSATKKLSTFITTSSQMPYKNGTGGPASSSSHIQSSIIEKYKKRIKQLEQ